MVNSQISEPVRIEFAPLTLLFGPSNAGKSTIVQALMYAREVLERNSCDAGRTELGGDVADLGGFENLVYGHDINRVIRMRCELDLREASRRREPDNAALEDGVFGLVTPLGGVACPKALCARAEPWVTTQSGATRPIERRSPPGLGADRAGLGRAWNPPVDRV